MVTRRQLALLNFIIEEYICTAEPVGSAVVCQKGDFGLSPATIRNEMSELEDLDLLKQPHTSAGRVPTDRAYRYYVNQLAQSGDYALDFKNKKRLDAYLIGVKNDPQALAKAVAQALSKISENLVITNIIGRNDFYKTGLSGLLEFPEFREFDRMFNLTNFFDRFDQIFDRIESEFLGRMDNKISISIGQENHFGEIKDEAVISAKYPLPEHYEGSLTLIGPTRMNYRKNLGLVSYIVRLMNQLNRN